MPAPSDKQAPRKPGRAYARYIISRAKELKDSSAFEPPSLTGQALDYAQVEADLRASRRRARRWIYAMLVAIVVLAIVSAFTSSGGFDGSGQVVFYHPADVVACWGNWLYIHVVGLFDTNVAAQADQLRSAFIAAHPNVSYGTVVLHGGMTFIAILCGCMLAASGLLFQTAFKNPLATPSMLGVADGVTLGCIIYAMTGHYFIGENPALYLALIYGCGAATLVVVFLLSRVIAGGAKYNIFDMLLVGTVITQLLSGLNNHISNFVMDPTSWQYFYELSQAYDALYEPMTYALVIVIAVLTIVPALLLRFRLNMLSFDDGTARVSGVRPGVLRGFALVLGSTMMLAAIASIGQIAMLSLAVPFLVRYLLPSEFRYQLIGNFLLGSIVLLVCIIVQPYLTVGLTTMPIGTVVGVVIVPFFLFVVAFGFKGWA